VLVEQVPRMNGTDLHRYPAGVRYTGQGALDLEVHLMQEDPEASCRARGELVEKAGGAPDVDPGLWNHLRKRHGR
jgi:hypothetical protein